MKNRPKKQVALLCALREGPGYGLSLIRRVTKLTDGKVWLHLGNVYVTLHLLEEEGLLSSWEADFDLPERGGIPRRYYKLTEKGEMVAEEHAAGLRALCKDEGVMDRVKRVLDELLGRLKFATR